MKGKKYCTCKTSVKMSKACLYWSIKIKVPLVSEEDVISSFLSIVSGESAGIESTGAVPKFSSAFVMMESEIFTTIFSVGFMDTTESFRASTWNSMPQQKISH